MAATSDKKSARTTAPASLERLEHQARQKGQRGIPPVHLWNPPFSGELDMRIAADGTWYYMGTPITRKALARLFGSVLRRDPDDRYYLVTPVEKYAIEVDDAPLLAVALGVDGSGEGQILRFTTNLDDDVTAGPDHPLRFAAEEDTGGLKPYVHVRGRLEALVSRAIFYDLVEIGVEAQVDGSSMFGVWSDRTFFAMAPSRDIAGFS